MAQEETQRLLTRARLWLEEGRPEDALTTLDALAPDSEGERKEKSYLLGWCYTNMRRWDDALNVLTPLTNFAEAEGDGSVSFNRTKRVYCLLRLGHNATNLARWDDAVLHFARCQKILRDKNLRLPRELVKACYGMATAQLMRGQYTDALQGYTDAVKHSFSLEDDEERGNIYYGLAYLSRRMGNLVDARLAALDALKFYQRSMSDHSELMVGTTHNLLGKIALSMGDYEEAKDHYTLALAMGRKSSTTMYVLNCSGLAEVRMAEKRFDEADEYCRMALRYMREAKEKDNLLFGLVYMLTGKVLYAKAEHAEDGRKEQLIEDAIKRFEQAEESLSRTQAYTEMAELYGHLAQALEELGKTQEAIRYWKSCYEALEAAKGTV